MKSLKLILASIDNYNCCFGVQQAQKNDHKWIDKGRKRARMEIAVRR